MLHILTVINGFLYLTTWVGHEASVKYHKNAFLNDPNSQKKRFLAIFWSSVCWIDLIMHILIVLSVFQLLATLPGHKGSFKNQKNTILNGRFKYGPFS